MVSMGYAPSYPYPSGLPGWPTADTAVHHYKVNPIQTSVKLLTLTRDSTVSRNFEKFPFIDEI